MNAKLNQNSKERKHSAHKAVAHALLLTAMVGQAAFFMPQAFAQSISPDQDSLLPPEVVPLDAAGGNQMAPNSMPAQNNFAPAAAAPAQQAYNPADMQTAQEWRKSAFNSMTNNPNVTPAFGQQANPQLMPMQGQMGQMPGQAPGQMGQQPGQSAWMNSSGQPMLGANQTQTLSGQVAQQPNQNPNGKKGSKLNGISHTLGMASLFGGGMLMGSLMSGRVAINPMSTGLMGVGLGNYAYQGLRY